MSLFVPPKMEFYAKSETSSAKFCAYFLLGETTNRI